MRTKALRNIVVDGISYRWKVSHSNAGSECREIFLALRTDRRQAALRVLFTEDDPRRGAGYPEAGVVYLWDEKLSWNLNRPRLAAELIRAAIVRGWSPEGGQAVVIEDGFPLLRELFPDGEAPGT